MSLNIAFRKEYYKRIFVTSLIAASLTTTSNIYAGASLNYEVFRMLDVNGIRSGDTIEKVKKVLLKMGSTTCDMWDTSRGKGGSCITKTKSGEVVANTTFESDTQGKHRLISISKYQELSSTMEILSEQVMSKYGKPSLVRNNSSNAKKLVWRSVFDTLSTGETHYSTLEVNIHEKNNSTGKTEASFNVTLNDIHLLDKLRKAHKEAARIKMERKIEAQRGQATQKADI